MCNFHCFNRPRHILVLRVQQHVHYASRFQLDFRSCMQQKTDSNLMNRCSRIMFESRKWIRTRARRQILCLGLKVKAGSGRLNFSYAFLSFLLPRKDRNVSKIWALSGYQSFISGLHRNFKPTYQLQRKRYLTALARKSDLALYGQ